MDERRFDAIARFLDAIQTRRGTLRATLVGVIGLAVLADPLPGEAVNKKRRKQRRKKRRRNRCPSGKTRCGGSCVNLKTDPRNCGACFKDCDDDEVCSNGECGDDCTRGLTLCNGVCIDTDTNDANCGRCGRACVAGQTCVGGDCEQECPAGQTLCDEECIDTKTDPENCGACGRECESGAVCFNGVCGCTVCDDDDECQFTSVQAAIDAAAAGDVVTICSGTYTGNITISKNVSLVGSLEDTELIGTGDGPVVTVNAGVTALLRFALVSGGTGATLEGVLVGGGIFNSGDLTVANALIEKNTAEVGAGIFNRTRATLTLNRVIVQLNQAQGDDQTFGGGLYNAFGGQATVTQRSAITNNEAANGGGIFNNGILTISDATTIVTNVGSGDGGGIVNDEGDVTIDDSTVIGNKTPGDGGGILNIDGTLTLTDDAEVGANEANRGGGVFNQGVATFSATDSAVTNNEATIGAGIFNSGGTVELATSTVFENDASDTGGGIFNTQGGVVTLDNQSAVVDNTPDNCVGTNVCGA